MAPKRYKRQRRLRPKRSPLKKIVQNRLFLSGIAACLILGGVMYGIFFMPFFQIKHIEIEGNQKIAKERLQEIAQKHLKHFLFANATGMRKEIQTVFPEIESVAVKKKFPDSFFVQVQERQGIAVWCQQTSFRECFALDKQGVIFEEKQPEREIILSAENTQAVLGDQVVDSDMLQSILHFQQALDTFSLFQEVGLRVSSFQIISRERINAKISEGWQIYFNPRQKVDWQVQKAKLVLEKEVPFGKRPLLEYIELRFGDQAYVKYRN